jgi:hypothetical protein
MLLENVLLNCSISGGVRHDSNSYFCCDHIEKNFLANGFQLKQFQLSECSSISSRISRLDGPASVDQFDAEGCLSTGQPGERVRV